MTGDKIFWSIFYFILFTPAIAIPVSAETTAIKAKQLKVGLIKFKLSIFLMIYFLKLAESSVVRWSGFVFSCTHLQLNVFSDWT